MINKIFNETKKQSVKLIDISKFDFIPLLGLPIYLIREEEIGFEAFSQERYTLLLGFYHGACFSAPLTYLLAGC